MRQEIETLLRSEGVIPFMRVVEQIVDHDKLTHDSSTMARDLMFWAREKVTGQGILEFRVTRLESALLRLGMTGKLKTEALKDTIKETIGAVDDLANLIGGLTERLIAVERQVSRPGPTVWGKQVSRQSPLVG